MKKLIKSFFGIFGVEIRKAGTLPVVQQVAAKSKEDSMEAGMRRAKDKFGINSSTIIDLGAAEGTWTIKAEKIWPEADFLLFEPLEERKKELTKLSERNPKIRPVFAAVGNKKGKVQFLVSSDLDGSGVYDAETSGEGRAVEMTTIDEEVEKLQSKPSFLIKFDTHGFELPILEGAKKTLLKTDLIIMECYGFEISKDCLRLAQMCIHMEKSGFRLADVVDIMRRPGDQLFWQCDVFFLPISHPFFKNNSYA